MLHTSAGVVSKAYLSSCAIEITITVLGWRTMGKSEGFLADPSGLTEGTEVGTCSESPSSFAVIPAAQVTFICAQWLQL